MFSYQDFKSYKTTIGRSGMNCIWEPICQRLLFKCVIIEHLRLVLPSDSSRNTHEESHCGEISN